MGKVLITAALPYANAKLHLGHLRSTYLPSDIYARYLRLKGDEVVYVCATDEHGTPIAVRADREGIPPKQVADKYYESILNALKMMNCSFDEFGRTTLSIHYKITQEFFIRLLNKGYITKASYEQLYCPTCNRFLPDRFVEGICPHCESEARGDQCEGCGRYLHAIELIKPHCIICKTIPETRKTDHWFFKLSSFRTFLKNWITNNENLTMNVKNYALQWLNENLVDWCITRDMSWGVPVPDQEAKGKVIYVWFDAPIGYISTTIKWAKHSGNVNGWKDYWLDEKSTIINFIGKDIIYHHAIFWPAMLKAHGDYNLPSKIIAGEYLTLEGKKMSKSRGWSIEVDEYLLAFEPDPLRYCLIAISPLSKDADFTWSEYLRRNNDELADILGNFIHRTLMFTYRFFERKIPAPRELNSVDRDMLTSIFKTKEAVEVSMENQEFHQALRKIMDLATKGNRYLNDKQPWKNLKVKQNEAATTIYVTNQVVKALAIMMDPFLPFTAQKIWKTMNLPGNIHNQRWENIGQEIAPGHLINRPKTLFRKLKQEEVSKFISKRK